ncbi:HalOD1 output domain-containing protein [Halobellus ordinarius]|uniref:HalOD1 output domain-containing protein n=1 Tax=Halobellus ordinarius TaxID=3075120 RepID=UPI003CE494C4
MTDPNKSEYVVEIGEEENVSEAVLRAVEPLSDRPLLDLPPLQESIDVDSLDRLFETSESIDQLQFEYVEYEVTIEPESVRVSGPY